MGGGAGLALLSLLVAIDLWAMSSTDPDYYLPDPFRPLGLALIALFLATGLLGLRARRITRRLGLVLTVVLLVLEARMRWSDDGSSGLVVKTEDVLLRYKYKAGAHFSGPGVDQHRTINHLGLMDGEHEVPKPADVFRVVVLSGSIANDGSVPYDQRFWRVLERELAGVREGKRVDVVNLSVHGYSEVQQVRMLEKVGLDYQPDLVVAAFMLTAATIQNGGYRRVGDSFFLFRFLPPMKVAMSGSICSMFAPLYERYTYDLVVRNSFERLAMLRRLHGFRALVAVLPVVEEFDDPVCGRIYDQVVATARDAGLPALRVPDAFRGARAEDFAKPDGRWDVCHPNAAGHAKIAAAIAAGVRAEEAAARPDAPRAGQNSE